MKRLDLFWKLALVIGLVVIIAVGTVAYAGKPTPPGGGGKPGCPKDISCPDVWLPVICADGIVYSNSCYADRACAPKPCTSYGGDIY